MKSNLIKGYRNHLGLTQADMAEHLSLSINSYRNKENGITAFTDNEKVSFTKLVNTIFPNITIMDIFFTEYKKKLDEVKK